MTSKVALRRTFISTTLAFLLAFVAYNINRKHEDSLAEKDEIKKQKIKGKDSSFLKTINENSVAFHIED